MSGCPCQYQLVSTLIPTKKKKKKYKTKHLITHEANGRQKDRIELYMCGSALFSR